MYPSRLLKRLYTISFELMKQQIPNKVLKNQITYCVIKISIFKSSRNTLGDYDNIGVKVIHVFNDQKIRIKKTNFEPEQIKLY